MTIQDDTVVIVATKRTAIGQYQGCFATLSAPQLASFAMKGALAQAQLSSSEIGEVLLGCVLSAGIGQAPARQAAIAAEIPVHVGAATINKMCGSGMKALMLGHDLLKAGSQTIIMAGGMESMTQAPYLLLKARQGYRIGHGTVYDHMFLDGLEDAYEKGTLMGAFAERCVEQYGFSRQTQDDFALQSLRRAQQATTHQLFQNEIVPVAISTAARDFTVLEDALPQQAKPEKIPLLKPAFKKDGTITPANASAISDGAAAHILMLNQEAQRRKITPLASILAHATHAQEPAWFTTAPIKAIEKVLQRVGWTVDQVDLFEINEAFACVTLAAMKTLDIPLEKVNIHGGACALGHPIGASGARIVTTLIYALRHYGLQRGVAALCIGGGEATAIAIEING